MNARIVQKGLKIFAAAALLLFAACLRLAAQVSVSGPTCVVAGVTYTYKITAVLAPNATMQVCITGGTLAGKDSSVQLSNCTPDKGAPLGAVSVTWSNNGQTSLTATSGSSTGTLHVTVTAPLTAGTINTVSKRQMISEDSVATVLTCTADQGGHCSPVYLNQWQQSTDAVSWVNIDGAISPSLSIPKKLPLSMFYRRKTTEKNSGTIAYSDVATIYVLPAAQWADSVKNAKADTASVGFLRNSLMLNGVFRLKSNNKTVFLSVMAKQAVIEIKKRDRNVLKRNLSKITA